MAAGDIIKGKDLRLTFIDGTVYHATECTLSWNRNFDEIASKDTDGNIVTPDSSSWTMSVNSLLANKPNPSTQKDSGDIIDEAFAAREADVEFKTTEAGDIVLSGKVFVENFEIGAAVEGRATFNASFRGNGNLSKSAVV